MPEQPLTSVIVPTRNSDRTLERCLESVLEQTVPCELIVVDNSSTDRSVAIANRVADKVLHIGPERSAQRNAGTEAASGEMIAFVDSDMDLEPQVIEQSIELIHEGAAGVIIPEYTDGIGFWAEVRALERSFYSGNNMVEAARVFPRHLLLTLGGFDETMPPGGEDWDMTIRARSAGPIARTVSRIRHDEGRVRYLDDCRKKAYYAPGLRVFRARYGGRYLGSTLDRPYFRQPWRLLYPHPIIGIGVLVLKAGEATAVGLALARQRD